MTVLFQGLRRVDIMSLSDPYAKVYLLKKSSDETDGYLKYSKVQIDT